MKKKSCHYKTIVFIKLLVIIIFLITGIKSYAQKYPKSKKYQDSKYYQDGLVSVEYKGKWGYVDVSEKEVIPCIYDEGGWFNNGKLGHH